MELNQYTEASAQPGLSVTKVIKLSIPHPPLPEQKAIAEALSDMDALIEAQKELIAKKRDIKQGTMQDLLSGRVRLPGYETKGWKHTDIGDIPDDWEVKMLGNFVNFQVGYPFNSMYFNSKNRGIRLIKNKDLKNDNQVVFYIGSFSECYLVNNGDLLIGMDGDFMPCWWMKGKALLNQRVGRISKKCNIELNFLLYSLLIPLNNLQSQTAATTVKHLSHNDIEDLFAIMPSLSEQQAIAQVLSDMDDEIETLEAELEKLNHMKRGMMQELLTGRIRLI